MWRTRFEPSHYNTVLVTRECELIDGTKVFKQVAFPLSMINDEEYRLEIKNMLTTHILTFPLIDKEHNGTRIRVFINTAEKFYWCIGNNECEAGLLFDSPAEAYNYACMTAGIHGFANA